MELRHLRYFTAVAETENVSRAALRLHVSQPALSRQVRDLEDELGFALLERSAKSVRLTEAGRVFLVEARAVLQRVEQAVNAGRSAASGLNGELHVGYAPTPTACLLPQALRAFQAALPHVRVKLHDLSSEEMLAGVRECKLHVAFTVAPANGSRRGLVFEELLRDPLRLAVAVAHPFARLRSVSLARAVREPFVAYNRRDYPDYHVLLAKLFWKTGCQPTVVEEHDGVSSLVSAVAAGAGVAVVPDSMSCVAGERLKLVRLTPAPTRLIVGAMWRDGGLTPAAKAFTDSMRAVAEGLARLDAKLELAAKGEANP